MAIDAALTARADLDHARSQAGLPEAERPFLLGAEHRIAVAEAVTQAKAEEPRWHSSRREAEPKALADPLNALRTALATLRHPDLETDDHVVMVECLLGIAGAGAPEPDEATAALIAAWPDRWAKRLAKVSGRPDASSPAPESRPPGPWGTVPPRTDATLSAREEPVNVTADEIILAGKVARGEVTQLPTDPTARAILAAGRKARGETDGDKR